MAMQQRVSDPVSTRSRILRQGIAGVGCNYITSLQGHALAARPCGPQADDWQASDGSRREIENLMQAQSRKRARRPAVI
jgi:hypothetical protein